MTIKASEYTLWWFGSSSLLISCLLVGVSQLSGELQIMLQWVPTQFNLIMSLYWPAYIAYKQRRLQAQEAQTNSLSKGSDVPLLEVCVYEESENLVWDGS